MHALFAVKLRHAFVFGRGDGLRRAQLDAYFFRANLAQGFVAENHVVRVARGRLHLAAHEKRVLVRHQKLSVMGNGRPAAFFHQRVMKRKFLGRAFCFDFFKLRGIDFSAEIIAHALNMLLRFLHFGRHVKLAARKPGQAHAHHAADKSGVKTVTRFFRHAAFFFHPARAALLHISTFKVFFSERLFGF